MKSAGDESPTFGELIAEGKLPGGAAPAAEEQAGTPAPSPEPTPEPSTRRLPRPRLRLSQKRSAAIEKIGGTVMPLAHERRFAGGRFPPGRHGADRRRPGPGQSAAESRASSNLKDTQITDAGLANLAGWARWTAAPGEDQGHRCGPGAPERPGQPRVSEPLWHGSDRRRLRASQRAHEAQKLYVWQTPGHGRRHRQAQGSAAGRDGREVGGSCARTSWALFLDEYARALLNSCEFSYVMCPPFFRAGNPSRKIDCWLVFAYIEGPGKSPCPLTFPASLPMPRAAQSCLLRSCRRWRFARSMRGPTRPRRPSSRAR